MKLLVAVSHLEYQRAPANTMGTRVGNILGRPCHRSII